MFEQHPLRVVVAGGGIAGLEALLALRELAGDRVALTLIEARPALVLHALEPAEPFGASATAPLSVADLAAATGAEVVRSHIERVDAEDHVAIMRDGQRIAYDALLIAVGARPTVALRHALTWWPGEAHTEFARLIADAEAGHAERIAFVVPSRCAWQLPAYELALMTARRLERAGHRAPLRLITPEATPLEIFGTAGSAAVARELEDAGVAFDGGAIAALRGGERVVVDVWPSSRRFAVDRVVSLPRSVGPDLAGLSTDIEGFIATDERCRVRGTAQVWAVGDATNRLPMHGGLAALQAERAARDIAAVAGAPILETTEYRPVLRAQLRTGRGTLWLQRDISDPSDAGAASEHALWSPPGKIAARRLGALLAAIDEPDNLSRPARRRFQHEPHISDTRLRGRS